MKKSVLFLFFLFSAVVLHAQWDWYNPLAANGSGVSFVHNQGWNEDGGNYRRLPLRAKDKVRKEVWNLSGESAGLAVRFVTDAENIRVRYQVTGGYSMPHMRPPVCRGLIFTGCRRMGDLSSASGAIRLPIRSVMLIMWTVESSQLRMFLSCTFLCTMV